MRFINKKKSVFLLYCKSHLAFFSMGFPSLLTTWAINKYLIVEIKANTGFSFLVEEKVHTRPNYARCQYIKSKYPFTPYINLLVFLYQVWTRKPYMIHSLTHDLNLFIDIFPVIYDYQDSKQTLPPSNPLKFTLRCNKRNFIQIYSHIQQNLWVENNIKVNYFLL